jgi:cell division protein DivIC
MFRKFLRVLLNRYVITSLAFAVFIIFFDNYSLIRQYKLQKQLTALHEMQQHYRVQIDKNRKEINELVTNRETLEEFAREEYLMKRDSEVVYVVIKE